MSVVVHPQPDHGALGVAPHLQYVAQLRGQPQPALPRAPTAGGATMPGNGKVRGSPVRDLRGDGLARSPTAAGGPGRPVLDAGLDPISSTASTRSATRSGAAPLRPTTSATRCRRSPSSSAPKGQLRRERPELGRGRRRVLDERLDGRAVASPRDHPGGRHEPGMGRLHPSEHRVVVPVRAQHRDRQPDDGDVQRDVQPGPVVLAATGQTLDVLTDDGGPTRRCRDAAAEPRPPGRDGERWHAVHHGGVGERHLVGSVPERPAEPRRAWSRRARRRPGHPREATA